MKFIVDRSWTTTMINWYGLFKGIVNTKLSKPIQSRLMMDIFDSNHAVEMRELVFPRHNKNKFIDG